MNTVSPCPHFVYELIDPRDNAPFYVGITIDLYERFRQHMHCDGINAAKDARVQEIRASGHLPIMRRLECVENGEIAREREKHWIQHYTDSGIVLLNIEVLVLVKPGRHNTDKDHAYNVWLLQAYGHLLKDTWRNVAKFKSYVRHHPPKFAFTPESGWMPNPEKKSRKRKK